MISRRRSEAVGSQDVLIDQDMAKETPEGCSQIIDPIFCEEGDESEKEENISAFESSEKRETLTERQTMKNDVEADERPDVQKIIPS